MRGWVDQRSSVVVALVVLALVAALGMAFTIVTTGDETEPGKGNPSYPDLMALAPDDLYLSREVLDDGQEHLLLRFTSAVANVGPGPLELNGTARPGNRASVVQVVYNAPTNGTPVVQHALGTDLIYHPQHYHFHLAGFASYALYRIDPSGQEVPIGSGGKQSSCVLDSVQRDPVAGAAVFTTCEIGRQGISPGWQDSYAASLPGQWVDLGASTPADGTYVLRYEVDPERQLVEGGKTGNNVAETTFRIAGGVIVDRPEPPRCAITGAATAHPGETITLRCSHFPAGGVSVFWGEWDPWARDTAAVAQFTTDGQAEDEVVVPVPAVKPGGWVVTVMAWDYGTVRPVSATVIVDVMEGPVASPVASPSR